MEGRSKRARLERSLAKGKGVARKTRFSIDKILAFTNNFSEYIASGTYGKVYKGKLTEVDRKMNTKLDIAVKEFSANNNESRQQYEIEKEFLENISHPNIIQLIGFSDDGALYLVFEFAENGSLRDHIPSLNWEKTMQILSGCAEALMYLHKLPAKIVFNDLKPENILLDEDFNPKLGDFGGIAEEGRESNDSGYKPSYTPGYGDPQSQYMGCSRREADVYAFGCILLELLTKRPILEDNVHVKQFVTGKLRNKEEFIHPLLAEQGCSENHGRLLVDFAMQCLDLDLLSRPKMREVVEKLREIQTL